MILDTIEIFCCRFLIKRIKKHWDARCEPEDFEKDCGECKARMCIDFLQTNIEILEL